MTDSPNLMLAKVFRSTVCVMNCVHLRKAAFENREVFLSQV